jgi:hypothetical protein
VRVSAPVQFAQVMQPELGLQSVGSRVVQILAGEIPPATAQRLLLSSCRSVSLFRWIFLILFFIGDLLVRRTGVYRRSVRPYSGYLPSLATDKLQYFR